LVATAACNIAFFAGKLGAVKTQLYARKCWTHFGCVLSLEHCRKKGATTLSIMTFSPTTLSITTLSITTISIMTLSISALSITIISIKPRYAMCPYVESFIVMRSVVLMNVVILTVIMVSFVAPIEIILNVFLFKVKDSDIGSLL